MTSSAAPLFSSRATMVARPRTCDAIGTALREAFDRDTSVSDELAGLLRQLSGDGVARTTDRDPVNRRG